MKDREITEDEINRITKKCQPREKAFFTLMRQSGLPPHTIKQLKVKNLERILDPNPPIPCKVDVPHCQSRAFIGEEGIRCLKQYLATRTDLTPESLLFTIRNNPNKQINTKDVSRAFRLAIQKLRITKRTSYETKKGEPNELRLYSVIKFYRKKAKDYLTELNNDSTPRSDEFYRELYEKKARPNLEIEPLTPIQMYQLERKNRELKERIARIENTIFPKQTEYKAPPEFWEGQEKEVEEHERQLEWETEHPEEVEKREKQRKEQQEKWEKEHPEEVKKQEILFEEQQKYDEQAYREYIETELERLRKTMKELEEIIQNRKS